MNTRKEITDIAISLFKKEGYDAVTIPMICKEAKISRGTFYYHFQSKDDIIYDYVDDFLNSTNDIMPEVLRIKSAKEQLWLLYKYVCENTIALGPEVLYAFFRIDMAHGLRNMSPEPSNKKAPFKPLDPFRKMVFGLIEKAQEEGEISKDSTPEDLEHAYNTIIIGTGLDWSCKKGNYDEIERLKKFFEIIFHE